jgi:uncharacterized protein (TIGR02246 family)
LKSRRAKLTQRCRTGGDGAHKQYVKAAAAHGGDKLGSDASIARNGADSYTVDAVNRHDAYAVAAVFWDDGIEVTPLGVFSGRAEIEQRLAEQYKATDVRDFAETIDEIHISGDHGWFVAHWSATNITQPSGERRPIKGYITCVLEKRNGEWKARMHTTFPSRAQ